MTRYSNTMRDILSQIREGFSSKEIKMAIGIASDKRYKGGNMTGAVNQIEKIKKGLSNHPQVAAVLKRQNEDIDEPASPDEGSMALDQLKFMKYAAEQMMQHIQGGGEFPEWMQNKLSGTHEKFKTLYANIEHGEMKESVELDEAQDTWMVKVVKGVNKVKAGDFVKVKARNVPEALKKAIKQFGDPNLNAVPSTYFKVQKEEVELEEKLKVSDGLGAWIDDFKKSDAPQFKGKSDEEKKNMAIAAFTDAGGKLDEGRMKELHGYIEKGMSAQDIAKKMKLDVKTIKSLMDETDKEEVVSEEEEPQKPDSAKAVDQMRDDKKKTRIAQLQLQIAKAQETINKLNAQEKPSE